MIKNISISLLLAGFVLATATGDQKTPSRAPGSLTQNFTLSMTQAVEVTLSFASVQNLSVANAGVTAALVNPLDAALLARMPVGVSIPVAFPALVDVSPLPIPILGLQFDGVADVILDTSALHYTPGTRLRLFAADNSAAPFLDITEEVSSGSYRVRGSRGEFSEFIIVTDDRDSASIVTLKFARLSGLMTTYSSAIVDGTLETTLLNHISDANSDWLAGNIDGAKADLQLFLDAVAAATPVQIPATWTSTEIATNVAGLLSAAAGTLRFSLEDARDTDLDGVYDHSDNCRLMENVGQCDTNADGFGNLCDADIDNNGIVNTFDLAALRAAFGSTGPNDADLNCNGVVNSFDLTLMRSAYGDAPGPSGPAP